jgi:hypothetical protein
MEVFMNLHKNIKNVVAIIIFSLLVFSCDIIGGGWLPKQHSLSPPWNTYLVGEYTTDTSGSVYGKGSNTDTFDGTNRFKSESYQHWDGGHKSNSYYCWITRIELHQESWEIYPRWRIFYKLESSLWDSENDFNKDIELDMRVPTTLSGKKLEDFVDIPVP